jgi:predicted dehydrogenase
MAIRWGAQPALAAPEALPHRIDARVPMAVVGVGGWGRNLARNFHQLPEADLRYLCDLDEIRLRTLAGQLPGIETTPRLNDVLDDPEVRAVVIATNGHTHYELAKRALLADKDVYVEKPFVLCVAEAEELIALAERRGRIVMVGHLLEYHPVIRRLKGMISGGELGKVHYLYSQRVNLGTVREDENAMWNFAPHDVSVALHLLGREPTDVSARGQCCLQKGVEDVVFMTLNFGDEIMAHIHVSWLDPHKVRKLTIVGSDQMAVFDDLEPNEKLRIYDKGVTLNQDYDNFAEYIGIRFGDITLPYIKPEEPLQTECRHFLECVRERRTPLSDGHDGLRVVRVLEAAQSSLRLNGAPVPVRAGPSRNGS